MGLGTLFSIVDAKLLVLWKRWQRRNDGADYFGIELCRNSKKAN
jgi:hypothetical protein